MLKEVNATKAPTDTDEAMTPEQVEQAVMKLPRLWFAHWSDPGVEKGDELRTEEHCLVRGPKNANLLDWAERIVGLMFGIEQMNPGISVAVLQNAVGLMVIQRLVERITDQEAADSSIKH